MPLPLEPTRRAHRPPLTDFQNPHAALVEYLTQYALPHADKDLFALIYLVIDDDAGTPQSAGYFSLTTVSVKHTAAARFYTYFGLASLGENFPCWMVLDLYPFLLGLAQSARSMSET